MIKQAELKVGLLAITDCGEFVIAAAASLSHGKELQPEQIIPKLIEMGHESVLEHASATFAIEGISRACSHQVVRHRICSFTQRSQRYCEVEPEFVVPETLTTEQTFQFLSACNESYKDYLMLLEFGVAREDSRYLLPNATATELVMTANLREWRHFLKLRLDSHAQLEIRNLAYEILKELHRVFPNCFNDIWEQYSRSEGDQS